ncbi:MAG TPA: 2-dehydro-3-deoxygalactonokinase [Burkholderiaceae bacterium]
MSCAFVAVDWGTTSLRAYAVAGDGTVLARTANEHGIQSRQGDFEATLAQALEALPGSGSAPVLMAGMIGSQQGWVEAPYVETPCSADVLARRLTDVPATSLGRAVKIVPGVAHPARGVPDVMRGEETQLLGLVQHEGLQTGTQIVCMPGTHCKWVVLRDGVIVEFSTYMTGELFKLLSTQSILGRLMVRNGEADADDWDGFDVGLERAQHDNGHLMHQLFSVRTEGLFKRQAPTALKSYLSGLLIGHELQAALAQVPAGAPVVLVGDDRLTARYRRGLERRGVAVRNAPQDIVVAGLASIARAAGWR